MTAKVVSHYGIHWDNNVAFLMQGRGGTNAVGLKEKAPFEVQLPSKAKHCNHQIPLAAPVPNDFHWNYFQQLIDDPLVRAMLPIPKLDGGCYYVTDPDDSLVPYLVLLTKLSSPIYSIVVPIGTLTVDAILTEMQTTNVQPFVATQCDGKHSAMISEIAKSAVYLPRKLVMTGKADVVLPPGVRRIETGLNAGRFVVNDMMGLPWEILGAVVVRKFMRREWHMKAEGSESAAGARTEARPRRDFHSA